MKLSSLVRTFAGAIIVLCVNILPAQAQSSIPIAIAGGPYTIHLGDSLILDGSNSFVANASYPISSYSWQLNVNPQLIVASYDWVGATSTHTFSAVELANKGISAIGTYSIGLRVSNVMGTSTTTTNLQVLSAIQAPVPEPETYAMLLAGLGLIGVIGRRRRLT